MGFSYCRFHCGKRWRPWGYCVSSDLLGTSELTDGEWLWPEGLPHYIDAHDVCLPEEFVARMELHGWRVPAHVGIRDSRGRRTAVKLNAVGYWAPSRRVLAHLMTSVGQGPARPVARRPEEQAWPDITCFVRPDWRPTDRKRIAAYLRSGHNTGMGVGGDPSFWLSWAARVTEGLRNLDPAAALGLSGEVRRLADDPARK